MSKLNVTIDGQSTKVDQGVSILQAAKQLGINIPTLCYLDLHHANIKSQVASCRICVVEVQGRKTLVPACATLVTEGMVIKTHTPRVRQARQTVIELLLSDHPSNCLNCEKSGQCQLQNLAVQLGIRQSIFNKDHVQSTYPKQQGVAIKRDMNKCILCRRCEYMCNDVQTVGALSGVNRGFNASVETAFGLPLEDTVCTQCGQCVAVCPTGALGEHEHIQEVMCHLENPNKLVIVQTAPAVRVALGEAFGMEAGTVVTGKMVAALKALGFDYVFDTNFAADVTIMEESAELIQRLNSWVIGEEGSLPILTSCCPAWVNFYETQFSDLLAYPSTVKSPQQIFGTLVKSYFAEKMNIPKENICVVSIMPCVAKKYEAERPEFEKDVDFTLSTRELAALIKQANIDFNQLKDMDFDNPLGKATGAAVLFGTTGGVMEAAVRTAYEKITGESLKEVNFKALRGFEGIRIATVKVGDLDLKVGVVHGLGNARMLMEELREGNPRGLHAIEVMACPGGCVGGGGQPYHQGQIEILQKRQEALYQEDTNQVLRKSHENPQVVELYDTYLGHPMSHKAHELLHTHYTKKDRV